MNGIRIALCTQVILAAVSLSLVAGTCPGATAEGTSVDVATLPAEFWTELGALYARWQANDKAEDAFAKAIELAADPAAKARVYRQLAQARMNAGDGQQALAALDAAVELTTDATAAREYRNLRAEVYTAMGDTGKAIAEYQALLALGGDPAELTPVRLSLLELHKQAGTLDKVIADSTAGLDKDAADAEALDTLCLVYGAVQPDNGKLAAVLEKLVAARPDDLASRQQLVDVYRTLGRHDKAAALLETMAASAPKPARASYYSRIAEEYAAMGKPDAAATWIEKLRQADSGSTMVRLEAARLYALIGKTDEALAEFRLAIEQAPTTGEGQFVEFELAGFYFEHGMRDEASALLKTLVEHAEDPGLQAQAKRKLAEVSQSIPMREREKPDDPNFVWPE